MPQSVAVSPTGVVTVLALWRAGYATCDHRGMSPVIWIGIAGGLAVIAFLTWWFWPQAACNQDCTEPRYRADHADPMRRWVHGILALYRGDVGDPAYWDVDCAHRQAAAWGVNGPAELHGLLSRYQQGEIDPAFDLVRIIWLARAVLPRIVPVNRVR
jgi:hypothetical protein